MYTGGIKKGTIAAKERPGMVKTFDCLLTGRTKRSEAARPGRRRFFVTPEMALTEKD